MTFPRFFLSLIVVIILIQGYRISQDANIFRTVEPVAYGTCEQVPAPAGAEDITIDQAIGLAYIGADDRRAYLVTGDVADTPNGGLWSLDLSKPNSQVTALEYEIDGPFHPHGIALYQQGEINELYVINHLTPTQHEVDVFTIESPTKLKLRARHTSEKMISPNDLTVIAQDQFLFTNDHGNPRHTVMEKLEDYLGLPLGSVVYYDGTEGHIVAKGLRYPNGITLSPEGDAFYVAETTGGKIKKFVKGESSFNWLESSNIDLNSGLDNLEWDQQGKLLTAAHSRLFDFQAHMNDPSNLSPSEVIQIDVSGEHMGATTLLLDLGDGISGSSVAATHNKTLVVGPVFEKHVLRCAPKS